ncbi:hypothetical protein [Lactococcus petauri]|uniref:hypothetical protein n=1 Tax=Lactococcus petauri TaxID=1940789 RepID=UPI003854ED00
MTDIYHNIINFSLGRSEVRERFNLVENFLVKQIIEFSGTLEDKSYFIDIIDDLDDKINLEVDEDEISTKNKLQHIDFKDADIKIVITYDLCLTKQINVIEEKNINEIFRAVIKKFKLKDISKINNEVLINLINNGEKYLLKLKTNWTSFLRDKHYSEKKLLVLPDIIPINMQEKFSNEIFEAFIDLIAEKRIGDDYLVSLSDNKTLNFSKEKLPGSENNIYIYLIIKYIFDDEYRYDDKLKIFRNILSKVLSDTEIRNINWDRILQTLKSNYSLFINGKMEDFIGLKISLTKQASALKQNVDKSIDSKVDDFSKQILIIVATILSSFIVKIGSNNQFILIISAIAYVFFILIFNLTKGIHFSSMSFQNDIEDIKEIGKNLEELEYSHDYGILNNSSSDINRSLKKLFNIENLQFVLLLLITVGLIAMLVIA